MEFVNNAQFVDVIDTSSLDVHLSNNTEVYGVVGENEQFGVLKIKMKKIEITKDPTLFLFTVDKTGSMEEYTNIGKTKMEIVIQTMINILYYLSEQDANIFVRVHSFNYDVYVEIETVKICKENIEELTERIRRMRAHGSTNIGKSLQFANETLHNYSIENPGHQTCHIFMTDGYATTGIMSNEQLTEFVSDSFGNVFIGFGEDHNARLLKSFSDVGNSVYQFVNDMENTALIYGEAIHRYLYPCVRKASLLVENGSIYNWKKNTWCDRLDEDILVSEIEKIYHIKKEKGNFIAIDLHGIVAKHQDASHIETITEMPHLITMETGDIVENDLTKYLFRHKTQELLFRAKNVEPNCDEHKDIKTDLRSFFKKMRDYMREKTITEDGFMKMLCDDIYIAYTTMGHKHGQMFAMARYTSQGRQQTYSATPRRPSDENAWPVPPLAPMKRRPDAPRPQLFRSFTKMYEEMCEDEETKEDPESTANAQSEYDEINSYVVNSSTIQECYATSSAIDTMSQIQTRGQSSSPTQRI